MSIVKDRPFKVLYLHQYYCPINASGGTRSFEFSYRFVRDGWRVAVISSDSEFKGMSLAEIEASYLQLPGEFSIDAISSGYNNKLSYFSRIVTFIAFAVESTWATLKVKDVDLVFATSTPLTIAIPALARKWLRGTPYIFEVRDLWPEMPIAVGAIKSPLLKGLARYLEKLAYSNAHHIIALSPGMKEGIMKTGVPKSSVTVIPNCSDNELFKIPESVGQEFIHQYPHLEGKPLIIYTGTIGHINDVEYLVEVAEAMQEINPVVNFLVLGKGVCEPKVRSRAENAGILNRNFWMWDNLIKQDVPKLYSASTLGLSLFKPIEEMEANSANKFFDTLAAGRPIVINYRGWQKEVIENSGAGFSIPQDDPKAAAQLLHEFISDRDALKKAQNAARKLADEVFDRELAYQNLKQEFLKTLNNIAAEQSRG